MDPCPGPSECGEQMASCYPGALFSLECNIILLADLIPEMQLPYLSVVTRGREQNEVK